MVTRVPARRAPSRDDGRRLTRRRPVVRAPTAGAGEYTPPVVSDGQDHGSLPAGALIGGRFKVERLIGRGGMGEVYAARHTTTGKEVALKLIHTAAGSGKEHVRRFMREARAATAIQHPNVIEVFDVFEDTDGTPVMVMELLKGEPFADFRERAGALELHQVSEVLLPAVRALQAAHDKGVVHRDLKPDNVFLSTTPAGRVTKLLDFGIAKVLDPTKISSETQGQQTNTGSILGTPHYMSFEQAMSDKSVDHRTDIWAMGVMIFEALTGRRPMTYETLGQMYASFLQGSVPSIREYLPDMPDDMAKVLDHCLAKKQDERLGTLEPLVEMLTKYADPNVPGARCGGRVLEAPVATAREVTGGPLSSSLPGTSGGRRTRSVLLGGVLVASVAVGVGVFALSRRSAPPLVVSPAAAVASPTVPAASLEAPPDPPPAVSSVADSASAPAASSAPRPRVGGAPAPPRAGTAAPGPAAPQPPAPAPAPSPKKGISDKLPY